MPSSEAYIWVSGWEEFQTFQKKRGRPWAPPWIKLAPALLDDPDFLELSAETRSLLVGIWMLFARSRGTVTKDTRRLSRQLHQRVTEQQLSSLNHAGFIEFCSGTVLERRRNAFWNRSVLDKTRQEQNTSPNPDRELEDAAGDFANVVDLDFGAVLKDVPA